MLPKLKSAVTSQKKKLYFATTCVGILMHNFLTAIAQWGDGVVSCLCCRSGVAEGVSASRANRTRTSRRNVLPVILMALTVGTWAREVFQRRRYPVTLLMERRIPEERNVHLFICNEGCLSSQGQKLIAMNFGHFVHWGFVHTSFKP